MAESQNVEWKESWRDDYLKWICGFANAQGGKIYIGVDDTGKPVGLKNVRALLEDIPNKIQDTMGIVADVNLLSKDGIEYIEIIVSPSSFPVSYKGEYHYRTGSTKQRLTGTALSEFVNRKTGFHWEDVTVGDITVDDLDAESFKIFRREALRSKRMTQEELNVPNEELLSKLHLMSDGKLKRSAVLLFYDDPSIIQNGTYVKIGKFGEGPDLQYEDTLEGSLITIADRVIDLIYVKYLKAKVSYEHDRRVETYPFARDAIREAVYNALVHNCYMFGTPIQIRIEDEAIIVSNRCILPEGWTADTLMGPHDSIPYNPGIANVFYRAGYIETWGRGIQKICDACAELGTEPPRYEILGEGIRVHFEALQSALIKDFNPPKHQPDGLNGGLNGGLNDGLNGGLVKTQEDALAEIILQEIRNNPKITQTELSKKLGISHRSVERKMRELRDTNRLERIGSKKSGHWQVME